MFLTIRSCHGHHEVILDHKLPHSLLDTSSETPVVRPFSARPRHCAILTHDARYITCRTPYPNGWATIPDIITDCNEYTEINWRLDVS